MFQPNSVIAGRYQVIRLVGQGGMSNLYLAYDRKYSNATVVVKEMTASYSDPKEQQMAVDLFHREAKLLASLNHRHIPKVFDYFQFAGKYYLSMEYIDGVDLAVKLEEKKSFLPEKQVLEWGEQIATVLFYLHKHEPPIVFRDVKPSNIMISSQGVKLIDFGIARHFDQAKKGDTMRIGSPGYAPPEQYAAQTDPRSDIYALGVTLHHALTGRDPTATNTPFLVPPARDLNPALSEATAAMLARATQLDPSDRYQSALDLKKDIQHILQRKGQSTRVVGAPPAPPEQVQATTPPASSTDASAPTAASQPVSAAHASNSNAASGSTVQTPAATSPSGSLSSAAASTPATAATTSSGKKKRIGPFRLLMVACLLVLVAAGVAVGLLSGEQRQDLYRRATQIYKDIRQEFQRAENPEDELRKSLLEGRPEALLPLLQSQDFKELSAAKQELFRLNLLAAGSAEGKLRLIHVLVPEGQDQEQTWKVAAGAVSAINGAGGMKGQLFAILPQTYAPDSLSRVLSKLSKQESSLQDSFLVLGAQGQPLPESMPPQTLLLLDQAQESLKSVPPLNREAVDFLNLFGLTLDASSPPTVWALPGKPPASALKAEVDPGKLPDQEVVAALLQQARAAAGRVLMLAEAGQAKELGNTPGEILLLSSTADELPSLGPDVKGTALVLSSPFERPQAGALSVRPTVPAHFDLAQARLYDALLLCAIEPNQPFSGLTLTRQADGKIKNKVPTRYRWMDGSWLPQPEESEKRK